MYSTIRLWIDQQKWIPIQTKFVEAGGDYLIMKLTNIKLNARISESVFDLKLPAGVQVIKL